MNRIYMTFPTTNDLREYPWLKEAKPAALACKAENYIVTENIIIDKLTASNTSGEINNSIRPVIKSNASLIPFIEKHKTNIFKI